MRSLLAADPDRPEWRYDIAVTYSRLYLLAQNDDSTRAAHYLDKAIAELTPLVQNHPDVPKWKESLDICTRARTSLSTESKPSEPEP